MSPRRRSRRPSTSPGHHGRRWVDTALKLSAYGIGLAALLAFWARISDGMAGCYAGITQDGAPAPLEIGDGQLHEFKDETREIQPGSVRVKVLPVEKK